MHFPRHKMFSLCALILHLAITIDAAEVDFNFENNIDEGKGRYSELVKKSQSYGECWKEAMSGLHEGCKRLTEEIQSRLALSFTNCFLKHTGLDAPCPCPSDVPIASCLKHSTDRVFNAYTEFYTHTQSICHYLQHREWKEEAAKSVLLLTKSSKEVGEQLTELSKSQSQIQNLQQKTLSDHEKLISNSKILNAELQLSRYNVKNVYEEFKLVSNEHKHLLFEVFDRVKNLQNFVLGEFSGVYTIVYYVITAIIIYIATSMQRTAEARIWLILVISCSAGVERFLTSFTIAELITMNPLETNVCKLYLSTHFQKYFVAYLFKNIYFITKKIC